MAPNYVKMLFRVCNNTSYPLGTNNVKMSLPKPKTDFLKTSLLCNVCKTSFNDASPVSKCWFPCRASKHIIIYKI